MRRRLPRRWPGWPLASVLLSSGLAACSHESPSPPQSAAEVLSVAEGLERRHRVSEALAAIESHWKSLPEKQTWMQEEAALREKEASLLLAVSRPADAVRILERIRSLRSGSAGLLELVAKAYLDAGKPAQAAAAFESLPPSLRSAALFDYGNALVAEGRLEEGAAVLAAGLARDPWREAGYLALGRALLRLGSQAHASAAKPLLERYRSGEAYRRGQDEALQFEFDGDEARGVHRRAAAEWERGCLFEFMELENQALRKNPSLGAAYLQLARLSLFLARPADAIKVLERLPEDPLVLQVLKEARDDARDRSGDSLPPGSLERVRDQVRARIGNKPLSESASDLLLLVEALEQGGKEVDARRLGLFLLRLAPERRDVSEAIIRVCDRPDEVFFRLWAMSPFKDKGWSDRFDRELTSMGIDAKRVREALR